MIEYRNITGTGAKRISLQREKWVFGLFSRPIDEICNVRKRPKNSAMNLNLKQEKSEKHRANDSYQADWKYK